MHGCEIGNQRDKETRGNILSASLCYKLLGSRRLDVLCYHCDANATPDIKRAGHFNIVGIKGFGQIIQNQIYEMLVENPLLTIRP